MITYEPLWETLKKRNITTYKLLKDYNISRGMLDNLKHNRSITMTTLNELCNMLDCDVTDIIKYTKELKETQTKKDGNNLSEGSE